MAGVTTGDFGRLIREWRGLRRFSQLELSLEAELSARHLSFLESGRSAPSREMVKKLAEALAMPRAIANQAMRAAGFAPIYPELQPGEADLAPVRDAVAHLLDNHEPLPAIAMDAAWRLVGANHSAADFFARIGVGGCANMIEALIALAAGGVLLNWEETAVLTLARLRSEIAQIGPNPALQALAAELASQPRLRSFDRSSINLDRALVPTIFAVGGERLSLFSTIASFGSVQDVFASDLRVELMFAEDEPTRVYFAARAGHSV
jgi:transcriptional regulator with XRE-family HTH domain